MRRGIGLLAAGLVVLAGVGCGAQPGVTSSSPARLGIKAEGAWIRTTDGASNQMMTALFLTIANPTGDDVVLKSAACDDAGRAEVHEMVSKDGKMVMQEAKDGVLVKAGTHEHLKPGGNHIMLMQLKRRLPVGDQSRCTLTLSNGTTLDVLAPVKVYTEEEDHYHEWQTASPSAMSSSAMSPSGMSSRTPMPGATISGTSKPTMVQPTAGASS